VRYRGEKVTGDPAMLHRFADSELIWVAIVLGLFVAAYIVLLFWAIGALSPKPELVRTAGCLLAVMWVGFWVWFIAVRWPVHTAGSMRPTEIVVREIDPATPQEIPLPRPKPKL
jgi:hypothetical protein